MRFIYALKDPNTLEIKYIGQSNDIDRRYRDHIRKSLAKTDCEYNTYKSRWIRKIINKGYKPLLEIIEECDNLELSNIREKYYIEKLTNEGYKLTNSHVLDVTECSKQTRNKISSSKKGKKLEEIVGEEKAKELKEYYSNRTKINNPNKSDDPEVREKISNTLKEYFSNPENHWAYGRKMSDDHNEKLRLAKIDNPKNVGNRKPRTEEQKEKLRKAITGRKVKRYPILQYDLEMNLIKEWKSLREIERLEPTFSRAKVSQCCKGDKESYANFIWKYKT